MAKDQLRCYICGKFIAYSDTNVGTGYTPDSDYSTEEIIHYHMGCINKGTRQSKTMYGLYIPSIPIASKIYGKHELNNILYSDNDDRFKVYPFNEDYEGSKETFASIPINSGKIFVVKFPKTFYERSEIEFNKNIQIIRQVKSAIIVEDNLSPYSASWPSLLESPALSYFYFKFTKQDDEELRSAILKSPFYSVLLAGIEGSKDDTRISASKHPECSYIYALSIDKFPHDITRKGACQDPVCAYDYARFIDKNPLKETRDAANEDPNYGLLYAIEVDKKRAKDKDSEIKICQDPSCAFHYAKHLGPSDITEDGACMDPKWAYIYAKTFGASEKTRNSAARDLYQLKKYADQVDKLTEDSDLVEFYIEKINEKKDDPFIEIWQEADSGLFSIIWGRSLDT